MSERMEIDTSAELMENDVLPKAREVHTDPNAQSVSGTDLPKALAQSNAKKSPAQWAYERIILYIQNFEQQLDNDHEVGMGLAGGDTGVIRIDPNRCDGCTCCIEACDFGAISINPESKLAEICNQCEDEEDGPQCVKWCPKEALELTTPDRRAQRARHKLAVEEVLGS